MVFVHHSLFFLRKFHSFFVKTHPFATKVNTYTSITNITLDVIAYYLSVPHTRYECLESRGHLMLSALRLSTHIPTWYTEQDSHYLCNISAFLSFKCR